MTYINKQFSVIQIRRGSDAEFTSSDPVLASGEPAYAVDQRLFKVGDGTTPWIDLPGVIFSGSLLQFAPISSNDLATLITDETGSGLAVFNTSPSFSGIPTAPTASSGTNTSQIATTAFVRTEVSNLVDSAPILLDTLNEIAAAINDDASFFTTISNTINSVSGSIPFVTNSGDNRLVTSDGTTRGLNAENNLTFDGSLLNVSGDLIANTGTLHILQLDTNNGSVSAQGQFGWNTTQGTVDLALTSTAIVELGEHQMYRIRNTTSNTLYRGQPVYASGVHSNGLITPNLYLSDDSIDEIRFIGLMYETVNNNNNGYVIAFGHMHNVDTRGNVASDIAVGDETWANGDILYPHPTVAGKLTKVAPKHYIPIALILDAANNGKIYVRRDLGAGELDDLHDVNVSGVTNGQFLQYNSSTDYWVPSSSGNFTTLLVNGTGVSIDGHTHTSSNITDFTEAVQDVVGASGFLVGASGISISYNDGSNSLTITGGGGGGATITNAGDNRILTSDGTSTGINGESNLSFDGSILLVSGSVRLGDTAGNRVQFFKGGGAIYDYSVAKEGNHLAISTANDGSSFRYTQFGYHSGSTWTPKTVINNYNGKIGIVNTTPSYELDVTGSGHFTQNLLVDGDCSIGATKAYKWDGNAWGYDRIIFRSDVNNKITSDGNGNYNWLVAGRNWTLSDVGNVGIKTGSPSRTLHVVGSGYFDGFLDVDNLRLDANTISSTNSNGNIVLAPNGTGDVQIDADTLRVGDSNAAATITSNGTGNLTISTNSGTNSGSIVINQGSNGNISITPNGTGEVDLSKVDIDGGSIDGTAIGANSASTGKFTQLYPTVVSNGNVSGSVATDVSTGQIFDMTVTGSTTLSNPTNSIDGVTIRWRIRQDGTGGHSVALGGDFVIPTSASSPLPWSTTANAMDILAATYHAGRAKWDVVAFVPGY